MFSVIFVKSVNQRIDVLSSGYGSCQQTLLFAALRHCIFFYCFLLMYLKINKPCLFFMCSPQSSPGVPHLFNGLIHPTPSKSWLTFSSHVRLFCAGVKESGLLGLFSEVSLICSVTLGKSLNLTVVWFIHYKISLIILVRFAEPWILFAFFTCAVLRVL